MTTKRFGPWTLTTDRVQYEGWSGSRMVVTHEDKPRGAQVDLVPNSCAFFIGVPLGYCRARDVAEMEAFLARDVAAMVGESIPRRLP